jgi:hypothetical protein
MNDLAERIGIERDGFAEILEAVAVSPETDESQRYGPARGVLGVSGGTVQVPPTRDGGSVSLTVACDTLVTLACSTKAEHDGGDLRD